MKCKSIPHPVITVDRLMVWRSGAWHKLKAWIVKEVSGKWAIPVVTLRSEHRARRIADILEKDRKR